MLGSMNCLIRMSEVLIKNLFTYSSYHSEGKFQDPGRTHYLLLLGVSLCPLWPYPKSVLQLHKSLEITDQTLLKTPRLPFEVEEEENRRVTGDRVKKRSKEVTSSPTSGIGYCSRLGTSFKVGSKWKNLDGTRVTCTCLSPESRVNVRTTTKKFFTLFLREDGPDTTVGPDTNRPLSTHLF